MTNGKVAQDRIGLKLVERPCPVCHSSDRAEVAVTARYDENKLTEYAFASRKTPDFMHFQLVHCSECDLLYANPAPTSDFLSQRYKEAAYDSGPEAEFAAHTYSSYLKRILPHLPHRGKALDIGTGNGAFLEFLLRAGFQHVEGVEPSDAPIESARDNIRPLIRHGSFNAREFEPNSYSLISCFQTLEHLAEPREFCREILSLLEPGGACFFVTHNYRAWQTKLLGEKSPIFDVEHLQLYSRKCLQYVLRETGYVRTRTLSISNRYPLSYWLRLLPVNPRIKQGVMSALVRSKLDAIPIPLRVGNLAAYGFKPRLG